MKKFMYIAAAALFGLTACTEDYKDWTQQQKPTQPAVVSFGDGSVTEVASIDLNAIPEKQEKVKVATIVAPTSSDAAYTALYTLDVTVKGEALSYPLDSEGQIEVAKLQEIIVKEFGPKKEEREIPATVSMWLENGATSVKLATSAPFTIKATPLLSFEEFIYEIGNESGWSTPHPMHGNGQGLYEAVIYLNGEFKFKPNKDDWEGDWEKVSGDATGGTLTTDGGPNMDGVADGFYFVQVDLKEMTYKVTPITAISIIGSVRGAWDTDVDMTYNENLKCWEARETLNAGEFKFRANHDWAINWGGTFDDLSQGGANLQLAADGPYIIRLYVNGEAAAHCTVKEDYGYPDFLYEIGNESGWSTSHALLGDGNGKYQGFYYLNGEFKFKPNADNWDDDYEKLDGDAYAGTLKQDGGPNVDAPEAGMYKIDVDLAAMTYQLTAITSVGIIGNGGDWATDIEMTYNVEAGCYEVTTELAGGEFKFRANHDWAINWGGSFEDLSQDGANLSVEAAGTYKVQLFLSYAGKHYCTVTPAN